MVYYYSRHSAATFDPVSLIKYSPTSLPLSSTSDNNGLSENDCSNIRSILSLSVMFYSQLSDIVQENVRYDVVKPI